MSRLQRGDVDALAGDQIVLLGNALEALGEDKNANFSFADALFSYEPYAFMVRRNDAAFRLVVNRALAELYRSTSIVQIYDKWFGALGKPGTALQAMYQLNALPE
jgi:glutamate/aspartate transport system substrate-binding protein